MKKVFLFMFSFLLMSTSLWAADQTGYFSITGNSATVTNGAYINAANSFTNVAPMTTIAESWIGPSSTAGVYFKGANTGFGTTTPSAKHSIVSSGATVARLESTTTGNGSSLLLLNASNFNYGVVGIVAGTGGDAGDVYGLGYTPVENTTFISVLNWTSNGKVSIGTTTIPSMLTVAGLINMKNYTVGTLPAGTRGDICYVTDALAPTFLATVIGGGAVVTPVFFNGAAWVGF